MTRLAGARVMVTGGGGFLGKRLVAKLPQRLYLGRWTGTKNEHRPRPTGDGEEVR